METEEPPCLGGSRISRRTTSLRWHYPDQVFGVVPTISGPLSLAFQAPPGTLIQLWGQCTVYARRCQPTFQAHANPHYLQVSSTGLWGSYPSQKPKKNLSKLSSLYNLIAGGSDSDVRYWTLTGHKLNRIWTATEQLLNSCLTVRVAGSRMEYGAGSPLQCWKGIGS